MKQTRVQIAGDSLTDSGPYRPDATGAPGGLVLELPTGSPGRAHAMVTAYGLAGESFRALVTAGGVQTADALEAAATRQRAGLGVLLSSVLVGHYMGGVDHEGKPWPTEPLKLDAARRYSLPSEDVACPACGDLRTIVMSGERACIGCRHRWTHPGDGERFVGADRDERFGLAVVAELESLGIGYGAQAQIAAGLQALLVDIAGLGGGRGVSFL